MTGNGVSEEIDMFELLALQAREEEPTAVVEEDKRLNRRATVDALEATDDAFIVGLATYSIDLLSLKDVVYVCALFSLDEYNTLFYLLQTRVIAKIGRLLIVVKREIRGGWPRKMCCFISKVIVKARWLLR